MSKSNTQTIALFSLYRNGKPFNIGGISTSYREHIIHHVISHLRAVTDDVYTYELVTYIEQLIEPSEPTETALYAILQNDDYIYTHETKALINNPTNEVQIQATAHRKEIAEVIQKHLQAVSDDFYTLEKHTYAMLADNQVCTSFITKWGA